MPYLFTKSANKQGDWGSVTSKSGPHLRLADVLVPAAEGTVIDVLRNFPWTYSPAQSPARNTTPYIRLREFYLLDTYINQLLKSYNLQTFDNNISNNLGPVIDTLTDLNFLKNAGDSTRLYEGMYDHVNPSLFSYIFPYFENPTEIVNTWVAKSTYNEIIQLQKKLVPFMMPEIMAGYTTDIQNAINEYFGVQNRPSWLPSWVPDPASAFTFILEKIQTSISAGVGGVISMYQGDSLDLAQGSALAGLFGAKFLSQGAFQTGLDFMKNVSNFLVELQRTEELLNIAIKSPMASLDGDPVIDKPQIWSSSQPRVFNISFPLYNMFSDTNENAEKMISRNWELCYMLTYQNLYNKRNLFTGIPPVFYEVEVPGVYYTKAAYVKSLNILNIGNIRLMTLPVGDAGNYINVNIPDAYLVNMTVVDFFQPSRNFLDSINDSNKRAVFKQI